MPTPIHFTLHGLDDRIDGSDVTELHLTEGLSERVRAEVVIGTDEVLDLTPRLVAVELRGKGPIERTFTLCLSSVRYLGFHDGAHRTRLRLEDPMLPMRHRINTKKFRGRRVEQIIAEIFEDHAVQCSFTVAPTPVRSYCVQYRETDLDFITRLAAFEGFHYRVLADGTVHFSDETRTEARLRDGRPFPLVESGGALQDGLPSISTLRRGARETTDGVVLADYDWKHPDAVLREVATAQRDAHLELYDYPAGFRDGGRGSHLALIRAESLRAESMYLEGTSSALDLPPGGAFCLEPDLPNAFTTDWLVVRARHHYGEKVGYHNEFDAIPVKKRWRPPHVAPRRIGGHQTAFVRGAPDEEIHTDAFGRFNAQMHWDREATGLDQDSRWLRWLQESASSMSLARVGWEVYVSFLDGDPDRPIGLGRAIDGSAPPTYGLPANKTKMTVWTPSSPATGGYNELSMDDVSAAQGIHLRAEKDYQGIVKNDRDEAILRDELRSIGGDQKLTVEGDRTTKIGVDEKATYGATSERDVTLDRAVTIGGGESVDVGSVLSDTVGKKDVEKVAAVRASLVGSLKMPDWKAMAKKALEGLVPAPVREIQALLKDPGKHFESFLGGSFEKAANAAGAALVGGENIWDAAGNSLEGSVRGELGSFIDGAEKKDKKKGEKKEGDKKGEKGAAADGWLPSLEKLKEKYSAEGIEKQLQGALSTATGGLSDMFKGDGQGDKSKLEFGWAEADKLIDLFSTGGIERTASSMSRRMVGGAQILAALKPIEWSSSGLFTETVGGLKLTKATADVKQDVRGLFKLTVLGPVLRAAKVAIEHEFASNDTIDVLAGATWSAKTDLTLSSEGPLQIDAGSELVFDAGDGGSTLELKTGSAVLTTGKLEVKADGICSIRHKDVQLTTGG